MYSYWPIEWKTTEEDLLRGLNHMQAAELYAHQLTPQIAYGVQHVVHLAAYMRRGNGLFCRVPEKDHTAIVALVVTIVEKR